jgi:transcriptional regulator with XRE-family HTH domain
MERKKRNMSGTPEGNSKKSDALFNRIVGDRLKNIRLSKKSTQTELAEAIGVTFQQIQKYEKGRNQISLKRMLMMCKALNIHYRYFCNCILDDLDRHNAAQSNSIITQEEDYVKQCS